MVYRLISTFSDARSALLVRLDYRCPSPPVSKCGHNQDSIKCEYFNLVSLKALLGQWGPKGL